MKPVLFVTYFQVETPEGVVPMARITPMTSALKGETVPDPELDMVAARAGAVRSQVEHAWACTRAQTNQICTFFVGRGRKVAEPTDGPGSRDYPWQRAHLRWVDEVPKP